MASQSKKKTGSSAGRNPDRKCGKAWKKPKPVRAAPTPERQAKDAHIVELRLRRKESNIARREAEKAAAELKAAEEALEKELALRQDPLGVMVKTKRKKSKIAA